jgi:hypothetical protein
MRREERLFPTGRGCAALLSERRDGSDDRRLQAAAGLALRWQMVPRPLAGAFAAVPTANQARAYW